MRLQLAALITLIVTACTTELHSRHALVDEILTARVGHTGLTNRLCLEYKGEECVRDEILDYDLKDEGVRKRLNALGFLCDIAGGRYKVCLDRPGFCHFTYKHHFLRKPELIETFIPMEPYQFLIDAKARCLKP